MNENIIDEYSKHFNQTAHSLAKKLDEKNAFEL